MYAVWKLLRPYVLPTSDFLLYHCFVFSCAYCFVGCKALPCMDCVNRFSCQCSFFFCVRNLSGYFKICSPSSNVCLTLSAISVFRLDPCWMFVLCLLLIVVHFVVIIVWFLISLCLLLSGNLVFDWVVAECFLMFTSDRCSCFVLGSYPVFMFTCFRLVPCTRFTLSGNSLIISVLSSIIQFRNSGVNLWLCKNSVS